MKSVDSSNNLIVRKMVSGLDQGRFYSVYEFDKKAKKIFEGYVLVDESVTITFGTVEEFANIFA